MARVDGLAPVAPDRRQPGAGQGEEARGTDQAAGAVMQSEAADRRISGAVTFSCVRASELAERRTP